MSPSLPALMAVLVLLFSCAPGPRESPPLRTSTPVLNTLSEQEQAEGWELLFDGVSTAGWRGVHSDSFPETGWEVRDGALVAGAAGGDESARGGDIVTLEQYGEFDFRWEWRLDTRGGNSGVKYCVREPEDDSLKSGLGLEYQILDDAHHEWMLSGKMKPNDYHTLGGLYELYAPSAEKAPYPLGEWNSSRIVSRDHTVQHWLNGALILEFERGSQEFLDRVAASKFKDLEWFGRNDEGHILLQDHGSTVHFRNLKIRDLSDGE